MKTFKSFLMLAALMASFAACTDDFATPDVRSELISVVNDEVKPGPTATDGQNSGIGVDEKTNQEDETAGGKDLVKAPSRQLRANIAQKTKAPKGN